VARIVALRPCAPPRCRASGSLVAAALATLNNAALRRGTRPARLACSTPEGMPRCVV
jgi:hypothetical protein